MARHLTPARIAIGFVCALLVATALGQTPLCGVLSGAYPRGQYLVTGTARVPAGQTLSFEAGCKVYFAEFSGLDVQGSLQCNGTAALPVVFTSMNDGPYNKSGKLPEAFDWNGLLVRPEAGEVNMSHAAIRYSTVGLQIASDMTAVRLDQVRFEACGSGCLSVAGRIVPVSTDSALCYTGGAALSQVDNAPAATVEAAGKRGTPPRRVLRPLPLLLRISAGTLAAAGAGLAVAGHLSAQQRQQEYLAQTDPAAAERSRRERDTAVALRNAGSAVGTLCCCGFAVTFFIPALR